MKLKEMIIESEYDEAFYNDSEYTDWINCMEYDYSETQPALTITKRTVLHLDNGEFSPFATVNS